MRNKSKILGAAAFSLALAGGGVAGALLGTPSSSDARANATEATQPLGSGAPGADHRGEGLTAAATAIGISEDDLRTALQDGQSIAQVAEANGVDVQTVIDAMVADATDRLVADLPDRITELVNREGLPEGGPGHAGPRGGPGGPDGRGPGLDAAATAIGISVDDLRTALQDGATIAEVAADHQVGVQTVVDGLVAEATTHLDEAVADGHLTEAEATQRKADLADHITAMVNGELRGGPRDGGPGHDGPPPAGDTSS